MDGWFHTADAGRLDEDGRLEVLGRLDDVVVSGGVKVPLPAVAARLRAHPDVLEAEVVGVDDPEWGQRRGGVRGRVARPGRTPGTGSATRTRARGPRRTSSLLDALPLLANGKVDRVALRSLA